MPVSTSNGWIGSDESGKGDYFGPLVVAAVYLEPAQSSALTELGVKDSKRISDRRAIELADAVRIKGRVEVVRINPPRYNSLYAEMKNLNRLLAWAHARALENLLAQVACDRVVIDQFAEPALIERSLMAAGRRVKVEQRHRAEADPVVAAASVVARAEFLESLRVLSRQAGIELPKGASAAVETAAKKILSKGGMAALEQVAKLHFQITKRLTAAD